MPSNGFTVLTYNIHKGFSPGNRRFVLHEIREALLATQADFLLLQEMQGEHRQHAKTISEWPALSQFEFLAEEFWPYHAYGLNVSHKHGHHGNALLSKLPFEHWENINVSPFTWASRSLLHGIIRLPNTDLDLHLVCLHFGLLRHERIRQAARLCEQIEQHVPAHAPLIVAGDFNDWQEEIDQYFHSHLGLQEVFKTSQGTFVRSFPAWLPMFPMDRIYFRGLKLQSCEILTQMPWRRLSDHLPLTANFRL